MEVEVLLGAFLEYFGNNTSRCIDSVNREQGAASPDPSITLFEQLFHGLNNSRFNPQQLHSTTTEDAIIFFSVNARQAPEAGFSSFAGIRTSGKSG
ncbi:hypothetical protein EsDP_00000409 [Epichloe bromicola]|uniref:Uncharacterized protein n=1 Tax=Epichloe bromicola TaxID=79588 RepID=A0ABQ0CEU1_9HYPO